MNEVFVLFKGAKRSATNIFRIAELYSQYYISTLEIFHFNKIIFLTSVVLLNISLYIYTPLPYFDPSNFIE